MHAVPMGWRPACGSVYHFGVAVLGASCKTTACLVWSVLSVNQKGSVRSRLGRDRQEIWPQDAASCGPSRSRWGGVGPSCSRMWIQRALRARRSWSPPAAWRSASRCSRSVPCSASSCWPSGGGSSAASSAGPGPSPLRARARTRRVWSEQRSSTGLPMWSDAHTDRVGRRSCSVRGCSSGCSPTRQPRHGRSD